MKFLIHHLFIPEEEEHNLIELAESEGVKDNEDGLEGWDSLPAHEQSERGCHCRI